MFLAGGATFHDVIGVLRDELKERAEPVKTERWQGMPINTDTFEIRNAIFEVPLNGIEKLEYWRTQIGPNTPWADDHFAERVGGEPLNPGEQWKKWPYARSAEKFADQIFNHTYMERLWPKFARRQEGGKLTGRSPRLGEVRKYPDKDPRPRFGIAMHYGDLQDLVELLATEPYTRQAYIPLFFPEDTGKSDGGRKVCTLGYHILVRGDQAHIWYPLRSCDFVRHFRDDCYLAVRLLIWIVDQCRLRNPQVWDHIQLGTYSMHMTSLHIFANDRDRL
jgi:thymidylate synthase